jgi:tetratricopeptide (TPR) repeat protein
MPSSSEPDESKILLSLLADEEGPRAAGLNGQQKLRLEMLVRSAKVSLRVEQINRRWEHPPDQEAGKQRLIADTKAAIQFCETEQAWLEDLQEDESLDAGARTLSLTVVLNAAGQAQSLINHRKEARASLFRAMALSPNFIDPYITTAEILLNGKLEVDLDWPAKTERMLKEALRIDPASRQALRLLAQLYGNPVFGKETDAIGILEKLDPDAGSAFLLATLYDRLGRTKDAIRRMWVAIALGRDTKESYRLFVLYCLKLADSDPDKDTLLEDAERYAAEKLADAELAVRVGTEIGRLARVREAEAKPGAALPDPAKQNKPGT